MSNRSFIDWRKECEAIHAEMRRLVADPAYIDQVLGEGAARAQAFAAETMRAVKDIVGFVHR